MRVLMAFLLLASSIKRPVPIVGLSVKLLTFDFCQDWVPLRLSSTFRICLPCDGGPAGCRQVDYPG